MSARELSSAQDLSSLLDALLEGVQVLDFELRYVLVNAAAARHGRREASELLGRSLPECYPAVANSKLFAELERCMKQRASRVLENEFTYHDGQVAHFELRIEPVPQGLCVLSIDITARKKAEQSLGRSEDRLRQAERMESVGMLAASVAHDFNNLLGVILGFGEGALTREGGPLAADVENIMAAARSSAELTRQLLAFARQQVMRVEVLDPVALLRKLEKLLRRAVGPQIALSLDVKPPVGNIEVDPSKLEQVVMNLVVNARDAITGRGNITISICEVNADDRYVREHPGSASGKHVLIAVSDDGVGMDAATQARIFEPFYTTKEHGKGTGLGLSTVWGVVKQSGGHVWVYSELGRGSTFKVYLPRSDTPPRSIAPLSLPPKQPIRPDFQVLVAEDDPLLRLLAEHALVGAGMRVRVASTGDEALRICEGDARVDLLITDVVMPGMRGPELIARAQRARPELKILCTSGYALGAIREREPLPESVAFLEKPYLPSVLVKTVRKLLEG